jgi:hypothetical protein
MRSLYCISLTNPKLGEDLPDRFASPPGSAECDTQETGNAVSMPRALVCILLAYVLLALGLLLSRAEQSRFRS